METGTTSFLDRQALTRRFEENLEEFLADYGFKILPYGHPIILHDNQWIRSRLRKLDSKDSLTSLMIKFSPDYIVVKETEPKDLFFVDAKASITPVFFDAQIRRIGLHSNNLALPRENIGDIEREAWFSYNRFFPSNHVAIIMASPYHPRLIISDWVSNIKCLWCLKEQGPIPWSCEECPAFSEDEAGFGVLVNEFAGGSGTPHTNILFSSMRTLDDFLAEEFGVNVDKEEYQLTMLDFVKTWPLNKSAGTVNWTQFNNVVQSLKRTCPWLKYRYKDQLFDTHKEYIEYEKD